MAIVGHFEDLDEARKLVQSVLLAGVIQEVYEEGQLLPKLPVMVIDSRSIEYRRESTLPTAGFYNIGQQLPWKADVNYTTVETWLKRVARQDLLDNFLMKTYKTPNDYRSIVLSQLRKGCMRTIEDKILYGSGSTEAAIEFDGLNKLCPATDGHTFAAGYQDYDMGGNAQALTIDVLRQLIDAVKPKPDMLLMTRTLRNKLSAAAFEKGISTYVPGAIISATEKDFGKRVGYFDGIPITISDYLVNEVDADGATDAGDKESGSGCVSVYAIRFGQVEDGGLCLCIGGDTGGPDFFNIVEFDNVEDYDAAGIRLVAYCSMAMGSTKAVARVHSINEDGQVT